MSCEVVWSNGYASTFTGYEPKYQRKRIRYKWNAADHRRHGATHGINAADGKGPDADEDYDYPANHSRGCWERSHAREYEATARDVTQSEVAKAEARVSGRFQSTLQDASQRLQKEAQQVDHLESKVSMTKDEAQVAMQQQANDIEQQANMALNQ